jgi:hypothetical protein
MRIAIRTSRWAIWARRIASLALPIEIISVFMHRQRMIPSDTFTLLFGLGLILAVLAIIVSVVAFVRLWRTGFRGWAHTLEALVLGLVLASPIAIAAHLALTYPPTSDVATNGTLPMLVIAERSEDGVLLQQETARAFPSAVARSYPLPPDQVFVLIARLALEQKWEIRVKRRPVAPAYSGRLHALAMTWLGYRDEVAVVVAWAGEGSVVSMRSASLYGIDDLGANGQRIEAFLTDLDRAVTEAQRQGPIFEGLTPGDAYPDDGGAETDG